MTIQRRVACWFSKATRAQAHPHARTPTAPPPPTHAHIYARTRTHPRVRAHNTHTEICNSSCFSTSTMVL